MDWKHIGALIGLAVGLSTLIGSAYAGFSWVDERYAKSEKVTLDHVDTCKKIEQISKRQIDTEIFRLEVKKAESDRLPPRSRSMSLIQFSPVDDAMLSRFRRDSAEADRNVQDCDKR